MGWRLVENPIILAFCTFLSIGLRLVFRMKKSPGPNPLTWQKVSNLRMSTWSTGRIVITSLKRQEIWNYFWSPWIGWSGITLHSAIMQGYMFDIHQKYSCITELLACCPLKYVILTVTKYLTPSCLFPHSVMDGTLKLRKLLNVAEYGGQRDCGILHCRLPSL